jgi:hypothetical protein
VETRSWREDCATYQLISAVRVTSLEKEQQTVEDSTEKPRGSIPRKPRGRPFQPGNPGRPPGSKNKATRLVQQLVEGQAEALTRKALEMAQAGDVACLRLLLNIVSPARKSQTIDIDIPPVKSAKDVPALIKAIWCAVRDGRVTPEEATALGLLLERSIQAFEAEELRRQVEALEQLEDVTP